MTVAPYLFESTAQFLLKIQENQENISLLFLDKRTSTLYYIGVVQL